MVLMNSLMEETRMIAPTQPYKNPLPEKETNEETDLFEPNGPNGQQRILWSGRAPEEPEF